MKYIEKVWSYFSAVERGLWFCSVLLTVGAFFAFDRENIWTLVASLIGVTSLIFNAKGHFVGQILMILFSVLYGGISLSCAYYGEMVTYLGMTAPMAVVALISWLRHPYRGNRAEVAVTRLKRRDVLWMTFLTVLVTVIFYFVLRGCHTVHLELSTFSVTTSFAAVYLTAKRSPFFALAYAANDLVFIALWILAATKDLSYLSVVICFIAFFANDLYGFLQWRKMAKRQSDTKDYPYV